jgi:hypothetical protein
MNNKGQGAVGIVFLLILFAVALYACFVIVKGWADNLAQSSRESEQRRQEVAAQATGAFLDIQNTRVALEVTVTWLAIEQLKSQATATQAIVDEQLKKAPMVVQADTDTGITKRWLVVAGALIVLMIVGGTGYYLVQLTETRSGVAHRGPEGVTVRRGNTFVPLGRTSGATTITPASWTLRFRNVFLELLGKRTEPVTETVVDHSGITPAERVRLASQALATDAIVGAAEAQRIPKGAAGRDLHVEAARPDALPMPPSMGGYLPGAQPAYLPAPENRRGFPAVWARDILHQLGFGLWNDWKIETHGETVDGTTQQLEGASRSAPTTSGPDETRPA